MPCKWSTVQSSGHTTVPPAQGGTQNQALGRSRGGFSTKIHARTNAEGLPIALLLTPGEAHDSTAFTDLMAEYEADPEVMLADKGYDGDAIRDAIRDRGGTPEIPTKNNRRIQHTVNRALYATRTGSSVSSTASRTAGAWLHATIIPPAPSLASPSWLRSSSGSALSTLPSKSFHWNDSSVWERRVDKRSVIHRLAAAPDGPMVVFPCNRCTRR
jgi:transposase